MEYITDLATTITRISFARVIASNHAVNHLFSVRLNLETSGATHNCEAVVAPAGRRFKTSRASRLCIGSISFSRAFASSFLVHAKIPCQSADLLPICIPCNNEVSWAFRVKCDARFFSRVPKETIATNNSPAVDTHIARRRWPGAFWYLLSSATLRSIFCEPAESTSSSVCIFLISFFLLC